MATSHPQGWPIMEGLVPRFPGGVTSDLMLLIVGIVGTTVAPWQLFFQQSNVIDKRITPGWLAYERIDTVIGSVIVIIGAAALMIATAFAFRGTPVAGGFQDAGATAAELARHVGPITGTLFVIVLLNAALIGAAAVTLATSYAFGDVFKIRHSLHWSWRQARAFYLLFSGTVVGAASLVLIPNVPLGLVTLGVQALAGILLPSATVFLLLLANDRAVLGPWVNPTWLNAVASVVIGVLIMLSAILAAVTLFPDVNIPIMTLTLTGFLTAGLLGFGVAQLRGRERAPQWKLDYAALDRLSWQMPPLEELQRPVWSTGRKVGIVALRAYLVMAALLVVVKIGQLALAGTGHA